MGQLWRANSVTKTMKTKTQFEDMGLWSVWAEGRKIGYVYEPDADNRQCAQIMGRPYTCQPEWPFVALEDWTDGVRPGREISYCYSFRSAVSAVVKSHQLKG